MEKYIETKLGSKCFMVNGREIGRWRESGFYSNDPHFFIDRDARDELAKLCHKYMTVISKIEMGPNKVDVLALDKERAKIHDDILHFLDEDRDSVWLNEMLGDLHKWGLFFSGYHIRYNKEHSWIRHGPSNLAFYMIMEKMNPGRFYTLSTNEERRKV